MVSVGRPPNHLIFIQGSKIVKMALFLELGQLLPEKFLGKEQSQLEKKSYFECFLLLDEDQMVGGSPYTHHISSHTIYTIIITLKP